MRLKRPLTAPPYRKVKHLVFLRDVLLLSVTAFGGPQAHIALFIDLLVVRRRYLSEAELIELYALCQILPGPTSTQTLTAVGFRFGGPNLAFLTLLVWVLPAATLMTTAGLGVAYLQGQASDLAVTRFIQPMAVAFVVHAAYRISTRVVRSREGVLLLLLAAGLSYVLRSPWVFPFLLLFSGGVTAVRHRHRHAPEAKAPLRIEWANFLLFLGVFVGAAVLGSLTTLLPIRLFENFYRNGSLIFGGGQVLIPLMYTEFVQFKAYLTSSEFLTGYGIVQAVPGPTFSFCAYLGVLSMRPWGPGGELLGSLVATAGIFLPGTFLIFFIIRFWEQLKRYRVVRASLEGINAASSGLVVSAAVLLTEPLVSGVAVPTLVLNLGVVVATLLLLLWGKIPAPLLIVGGLLAGLVV